MRLFKKFISLSSFLLLFSCYNPEEPIMSSENIILVTPNLDSILADEASTVDLYGYIPENAEETKRIISFETTKGVFTNNGEKKISVKADSVVKSTGKRIAVVTLKSDLREGIAIITVSINESQDKDTVRFTKALPEGIKVERSAFSVISGFKNEIKLVAQLTRSKGKPSTGAEATFQVKDTLGKVLSTKENFREPRLTSNDTARVSTIFSSGNVSYTGKAWIVAYVSQNPILRDSTSLYIYPE